jgi:hypothetical protein
MEVIAVRHRAVRNGQRPISIGLAAILAVGFFFAAAGLGTQPAEAKPIRKDGKIHACYRVKGKPRGDVRILFRGKRCRRGERRVAWTAAGAGPQPQGGNPGAHATSPPDPAVAALAARVDALESRAAGLEKAVESSKATIAALSTKVATLELAGLDLENMVGALCGQLSSVATRWNELRGVVGGLSLTGVVGGLLEIPTLPEVLDPIDCG